MQWVPWHDITKDGLANAIDTCRIFEELFDFWDEDGDGWDVLRNFAPWGYGASPTILLWLIQSSSPDIKANYDTGKVKDLIRYANDKVIDAMSLLLKLGPPGTIDSPHLLQTVHSNIRFRHWDRVKMLLALGVNPHRISNDYHNSPRAESLLSLAMYSSWAFSSFRDALYGINLDVEDFARQELQQGCPLLDAGWQIETLSALLELDFEPDMEPPYNGERHPNQSEKKGCCDSCGFRLKYNVQVQPYWQHVLESIKDGIYPRESYSESQDEHLSRSQSHLSLSNITNGSALSYDPALPDDQAALADEEHLASSDGTSGIIADRKEVWCIYCWYYFKETGRRRSPAVTETDSSDGDDSSEDDFSPFLFNT